MLGGFSLAQYVSLVDWTRRLVREGKANVSAQVGSMLERLGMSTEVWKETLERLFSKDRFLGVAFAFSRERLRDAAAHRGCHHVANLDGCRASRRRSQSVHGVSEPPARGRLRPAFPGSRCPKRAA